MNQPTIAGILALLVIAGTVFAAPDTTKQIQCPEPQRLQTAMWHSGKLHDFKLEGNLHIMTAKGKSIRHPVIIRTKDRVMRFEFKDKPLQIQVTYLPGGSVIQRRANADAEWQLVAGKDRLARILDSDIAYEDLGLDFFRWSTVKPVGTDSIFTLPAWCYESTPPVVSNYAKVRFWVSTQHLAVLRADAYAPGGDVVKRVEALGVTKVEDAYTLKEMKMSTMMPGRNLIESSTFIEIGKTQKDASGL